MQLSPSDPDIQTLLLRIEQGDLDLQPDFQRGEVWTVRKKKRLIDSILRNWYVPPVHTILVPDSRKQDVLDGQQRLAAIRDFAENRFSVDGRTPPYSPEIERLNGLRYSSLPAEVRRAFDSFTIRVIRISDYSPEEPGELFYRLNQITSITAAEQRNAFYGPVRHQVKNLVDFFQSKGNAQATLGFSNSRMAYDDVISKLLCTLEVNDLSVQLTASYISDRFRYDRPFNHEVIEASMRAIDLFSSIRAADSHSIKFNKATLLSWLVVIAAYGKYDAEEYLLARDPSIISTFEARRTSSRVETYPVSDPDHYNRTFEMRWTELFALFSDRSTSRVLDITSVVYRDFILHLFIAWYCQIPNDRLPFSPERRKQYRLISEVLTGEASHLPAELVLEEFLKPSAWGRI